MISVSRARCPYSGKICHRSERAAYDQINRLRKLRMAIRPSSLQVYFCSCGWWHVGHAPRRTAE